jgi:hypothetical protein
VSLYTQDSAPEMKWGRTKLALLRRFQPSKMTFLMPSGVFGDENGSLASFNREHFRVTMEIVH